MPSIKVRQRITAQNFISSSGLYKEVNIPWQDVFIAASAISAAAGASMSASRPSASGPIGLLFAGTSSGCFYSITFRTPQDIAIAAPAGGSGQVLVDWTSTSVNQGVAAMAACLIHIPSGSEYTATGASQRLGSGSVAATGACIGQINSSSVIDFNFPTNRTGLMMLSWQYAGQNSATTTASSFLLYGIRVRYLSDRMGS